MGGGAGPKPGGIPKGDATRVGPVFWNFELYPVGTPEIVGPVGGAGSVGKTTVRGDAALVPLPTDGGIEYP